MANVIFTGTVPDQQQVDTITVSGTWAAADTATITCGGASLTVTVASDTALADIAEIIGRMINGDALKNDETRTATGDDTGPFNFITATYAAAVLTLTADQGDQTGDSEPFTVTRSEVTAGSGALGAVTSVTAHTGPYDANAALNWSDSAVPDASDVAILTGPNKHLRWNLTAIAAADLTKFADFTGDVGLPYQNTRDPNHPYKEYRTRKLRSSGGTIILEKGGGNGSSLCMIECNNVASNITIFKTGPRAPGGTIPPLQIEDINASGILRILGGDIGIDTDPEAAATAGPVTTIKGESTVVECGTICALGATVVDAATVVMLGTCSVSKLFNGAQFIAEPTASISGGTITAYSGGQYIIRSASIGSTAIVLAGGGMDFSTNPYESISNGSTIEIHGKDSWIIDPQSLLGNAYNIDLNQIGIGDMARLDIGKNKRLTIAAVA